jgi:cell division protein FtsW
MNWLPRARYGLDGPFCAAVAALLGWGLVMVASASVALGDRMSGNPLYFFDRQMLFAVLGVAIGVVVFAIPMATWEKFGPVLLGFALFLLVAVMIPGIGLKINYSRRWLEFGLFRLQASEPARLGVIIYLAGYIVRRQTRLQSSFMGLAAPFIPLGVVGLLLLAEPDFGATAILVAVALMMLFIGGARLLYLGGIFAGVTALLGVIAVAAPYRVQRMLSFVKPWADADRTGWQLTQSLIAIGRGEWFGVGLGNSVQKLLYLPEMHTDFIFAILAEEFGLVGVAVLIVLFGVVVWRGFAIGQEAERQGALFPAYLCYGLSGWIGLQALINMAVNMGMLPTKGLTLPFVSYGGSSLITVCVVVGLILRVDHENRLARVGHPAGSRRDYALKAAGARA